ncbi:alpha/beta hydrolase [Nostoc sp. UHCC 0870]|uniref:alpha/beta hydrolase n=1 Tax=Nostoc sp. UHCC 0870 TaxID=2914041 RepID=UPI001EDEAA1F|nr:alpha/beta hydrolase [Nostoc sp. UHCC 0870]UKO97946.1 alpha/beta hydrolase [Nostoc sp. UHCC 0870]
MQIFSLLQQLHKYPFKQLFAQTAALGMSIGVFLSNTHVYAAEQVVLKYGNFQTPISVQELNQFAATGETTPALLAYFQVSQQDPDLARKALQDGIKANPALLNSLLSSWTGPILVSQIGEVVRPPAKPLDQKALRSAVTASIQQDGEVTLLGAIRNYPEATVELQGEKIIPVYQRLNDLAKIFGFTG